MQILALLRKELLIEGRSGQTAVQILSLSVLMSSVAGIGLSGAFLGPAQLERLFPAVLWMVFLFSATIGLSRSFDPDLADDALSGLLFSGVPAWKIYIAKAVQNFFMVLAGHLLSAVLLSGFLSFPLGKWFGPLTLLSGIVLIGYSALATLLVGIAGTSRLRALLFPIILLPLLFPVFFGAVELTSELAVRDRLDYSSPWLSLLILLDGAYLVAGVNLFDFVVRE